MADKNVFYFILFLFYFIYSKHCSNKSLIIWKRKKLKKKKKIPFYICHIMRHRCIIVTYVEQSSNPVQGCFHFNLCKTFMKGMNQSLPASSVVCIYLTFLPWAGCSMKSSFKLTKWLVFSFPSLRLVVLPRFKNALCFTILYYTHYSWSRIDAIMSFF